MYKATNFYAMLGVPIDATPKEIRQAYHLAARRMHPDVNKDPNAETNFLSIQRAYETLNDPNKRTRYDNHKSFEAEVPPVTIHTIYSRPSLVQLDESQLIYSLLEVRPTKTQKEISTPPLNLCLVLDRSTSMEGTRLQVVKETAIDLLSQLYQKDIFSIVAFSDHAEVLIPSGTRIDRRTAENKIRSIQAGGSTEIYRGLEAGYKEIRRNLRPSNINHLILITDGRTYGDEGECLEIATQSGALGIGLSGLGIGSQWNDTFLDNLAALTSGNSAYVSSMSDIAEFLRSKVRSLGQVFAEGVTLDVNTGPDIEIRYAFRLDPDIASLDPTPPLPLGNIQIEMALKVILEILVPKIPSQSHPITLAEGSLRMTIPSRSIPIYNMRILLSRPVNATPDPEPPPLEIMLATERITLYRLQERARDEVTAGDIGNATRRLENLASHLLSRGQHKLAQTVQQEAKHLQRENTYSEDGEKQIKYGTRSLTLPDLSDGKIL